MKLQMRWPQLVAARATACDGQAVTLELQNAVPCDEIQLPLTQLVAPYPWLARDINLSPNRARWLETAAKVLVDENVLIWLQVDDAASVGRTAQMWQPLQPPEIPLTFATSVRSMRDHLNKHLLSEADWGAWKKALPKRGDVPVLWSELKGWIRRARRDEHERWMGAVKPQELPIIETYARLASWCWRQLGETPSLMARLPSQPRQTITLGEEQLLRNAKLTFGDSVCMATAQSGVVTVAHGNGSRGQRDVNWRTTFPTSVDGYIGAKRADLERIAARILGTELSVWPRPNGDT
ncbi:MAG: hypothetical protein EXR77_16985 [Myxococcales bacterium]|nr:hypothetical protein [Myxococcales bacterium]